MGQPLEFDVEKNEDIGEFLVDLFVAGARNGRDLEVELDNNIEEDEVKEKDAGGATAEVKLEEVARFNNYMDAVFRRMNAALRAKLMDPMELNLNQKIKKDGDRKEEDEKKDIKKRVEREATEIEEVGPLPVENMEETEDLVDRMGSVDKKNAKKGKSKEKKTEMKNKNKGDKQKGAKNKNKGKGGNKGNKDPKVKAKNKAERQKKREEKRAMKKKEKTAR